MTHFLGIDVGTGSARAGLFDAKGVFLGAEAREITIWRPRHGYAQQSSADIWSAVCQAVRSLLTRLGEPEVSGIGFDATCSLVVEAPDGGPISIDPDRAPDQDVIMWMDHRALSDAEEINAIGGAPLAHVGGRISPEMQMPKLRWLAREMPEAFARAGMFWDLPDWLVHRATGTAQRSLCSAVCKWTYLGHQGHAGEGWDTGFLASIGLAALAGLANRRIGQSFAPPGHFAGRLDARAAAELGLPMGIPVGASLIDAYAGALGTLCAGNAEPVGRLAVIAGTSACHIGLTAGPVFVGGVWGPYFGALLPDHWAVEGGQSAAGALLDAVLTRHGAFSALRAEAERARKPVHDLLEARLVAMGSEVATLTRHRHVQPDVHGNRSPLAEAWRRGAISGLTLENGPDDMALDYLAAIQALAYGTRHIVEEMRKAGMRVEALVLSGGLARNALFQRETADACGIPVIVPDIEEPVLLGAAILGATASGAHATLVDAMRAMTPNGRHILPRGGEIATYHDRKYAVFRRMQDDHAAYRALMEVEG